ncbi:MAG: ATP phosphoribosyltransferase, partial [Bacteroidota bacterium]
KATDYAGVQFFQGKKIATSYPGILSKYLKDNGVEAEIHKISGSVEIAPGIGLADGICDIVSSGSTLFSNGLKEVDQIFQSQAVLVTYPKMSVAKEALLNKILFRIEAVNKARRFKYILLNAPDEQVESIISVLPGMKSPTVMPLATKGWSSVHTVIEEEAFWDVIDQLKAQGAQGILVVPIEKMVL